MENISIKKVETKREMDDFVKFTNWLYADCPYYVPDLEMDIRNTFTPRKNAGLEYSVLQPFIAYNEAGKPVGRIAGIINYRANQKWQSRTAENRGAMGQGTWYGLYTRPDGNFRFRQGRDAY